MADTGGNIEGVQVPLVWTDADEVPIWYVNQMIAQYHAGQPNEFIISFGQASPPIIFGTPDEVRQRVSLIDWVPVKTVARIGLTRGRLEDLIRILGECLTQHDELAELMKGKLP